MDQNINESPEKESLNKSDSDNESTLTTQDTYIQPVQNNLNNSRVLNAGIDKLSNLDSVNYALKNEHCKKKAKVSFSPDEKCSSNCSSSDNEDDNIEYKLIEKNLNNSLTNGEKFNFFLKKSLSEETLNERHGSILKTSESNRHSEAKSTNLIMDEDFHDQFYDNQRAKNEDEDFIEEDFAPLNLQPRQCLIATISVNQLEESHENRDFRLAEACNESNKIENTDEQAEILVNENPPLCSNSLIGDDNYSDQIETDKTAQSSNSLGLKVESSSSIEDNDLSGNSQKSQFIKNVESPLNCIADYESMKITKAFIWSEAEAIEQQYEQIGASACGATAALNILKALHFQYDVNFVCSKVKVNQRIPDSLASATTLAQYLHSRSIAGMNSMELIENIESVTQNKISGRFFSFYPQRDINLTQWLIYWINKGFSSLAIYSLILEINLCILFFNFQGAVPSALLNLQKQPIWGFIPDAWHHQMIYASDSDCIYLTNPLEVKSVESIMKELTSESHLLVRSADVIKRFNANNQNLIDLLTLEKCSFKEKKRWFDLNVIGQCVNVLRESRTNNSSKESLEITESM